MKRAETAVTTSRERFIGPFDGDCNNNESESEGTCSSSHNNSVSSKICEIMHLKANERGREEINDLNLSKLSPKPIFQNYKEKKKMSWDKKVVEIKHPKSSLSSVDWEAIEANIRAATDEEKRRRNDREEIRKRLAMGIDSDNSLEIDKTLKKPSLQSRLQTGTNLQICFMNETASDGSDTETQREAFVSSQLKDSYNIIPDFKTPASLPPMPTSEFSKNQQPVPLDFFTQQAKLQQEARAALAQAKELARVQMQVERQQRKHTRISDLVRQSLEKLGIPFPWDCRRLSRQILTELNIAQLQVIVNDLHTQIEGLNEELVQLLLKRDDCHMEQDSMLVDIEDLTRYLTAKQMASEAAKWNVGPISLPTKSESAVSLTRTGARSARLTDIRK